MFLSKALKSTLSLLWILVFSTFFPLSIQMQCHCMKHTQEKSNTRKAPVLCPGKRTTLSSKLRNEQTVVKLSNLNRAHRGGTHLIFNKWGNERFRTRKRDLPALLLQRPSCDWWGSSALPLHLPKGCSCDSTVDPQLGALCRTSVAALLQTVLCLLALWACWRESLWLFYYSDTDCEIQCGAQMRAAAKHAKEQRCGVEDC